MTTTATAHTITPELEELNRELAVTSVPFSWTEIFDGWRNWSAQEDNRVLEVTRFFDAIARSSFGQLVARFDGDETGRQAQAQGPFDDIDWDHLLGVTDARSEIESSAREAVNRVLTGTVLEDNEEIAEHVAGVAMAIAACDELHPVLFIELTEFWDLDNNRV